MTDQKLQPTQSLFTGVPVGARVGVIQAADDDEVRLLGYGVRLEDSVPIQVAGKHNTVLEMMHVSNLTNPTMRLDDGTLVYGAECWWGPENSVKTWIGERRVINVKPRR